MNLAAGMLLDGDFELLRPIGEGGMGVVWLAHERSLHRDVALKVMRPSGSSTRIMRFARETQALAALDNPSILPILRTGTDPATGLHYLATRPILLSREEVRRLCDEVFSCPYPRDLFPPDSRCPSTAVALSGSRCPDSSGPSAGASPREQGGPRASGGERERSPLTLARVVEGGKTLPEAAVMRIARDLAGALSAAHAAGILHRDLKPSNILVDSTGRAILSDFGLAKFVTCHSSLVAPAASPPDSISLDESGNKKFLGSPGYAAPEQFRAGAALTPALDWYAFGAVLYEALTGQRPRSLRRPSSFDPEHISRHWDTLLAALLEPDPARRLSDPAAILRALDRIARHPARSRRHRWLWLGGMGLLGILGALCFLVNHRAGSLSPASVSQSLGLASDETAASPVSRSPDSSGRQSGWLEDFVRPAALLPPRLPENWQGNDIGPLQLLNTFHQEPVDSLITEAIASADPETQRLLREGDAAWQARPRDLVAANAAYSAAARHLRDIMNGTATNAPPADVPVADVPIHRDRARASARASLGDRARAAASASLGEAATRVNRAVALARLCWTYVANGNRGACDIPYKDALALLDPLVEADADRYGPLRAWLLAERAYMEGMEGRFREALADLSEAIALMDIHVRDKQSWEVQSILMRASMSGLCRKIGEKKDALGIVSDVIGSLSKLLPDASAADDETGDPQPDDPGRSALINLLAGCYYRLGEILRDSGSRLEAMQGYRRSLDIWRVQFKRRGEGYRPTYAQVLGRIGLAYADLYMHEESIAVWEEMRETLRPLLASDPEKYAPIVVRILENIARASRELGDESRAAAAEAEAAALQLPAPAP